MKTFVETSVFTKQSDKILKDGELAAIQDILSYNNEAGDLIPGSGGLWKIRYSNDKKGKRGGVRVIYYIHKPNEIYLLYLYKKSGTANLTSDQIKLLSVAVEQMINGK